MRLYIFLAITLAFVTSTLPAQTLIDSSDSDLAPGVLATPGADGSIHVAWRSEEGTILLCTFSGDRLTEEKTIEVSPDLQLLGGLARDEQGNVYVAAYRQEEATAEEWNKGYRPDVANVFRIRAGADRAELLADINQQEFSKKWPIMNPVKMDSTATVNAEMVYANDTLALALGHNNGKASDIHSTGLVVGVGTDGSVKYGQGGGQHIGHTRLAVDGKNFVHAQTFDQGIGLATLKQWQGSYLWSELVLVHEIRRPNPAEEMIYLAGIVPTDRSYLLVFSAGKGWLWNFGKPELGTDGACQIKVMKVSKDFDKLPKFDWNSGQRHAQGSFPLDVLAHPSQGKSYIRPIVATIQTGRSVVIFEQWGNNKPEGVKAVIFNDEGKVLLVSDLIENLRIQKSSQAFALPGGDSVGWVNGDASRKQFVLHTLDTSLNHRVIYLGGEQPPEGSFAPAKVHAGVMAGPDTENNSGLNPKDIFLAKIEVDGKAPSLAILVPQFEQQMRTELITIEKIVEQLKTGTEIIGGKKVTRTYTERIPVTEQVEREIVVNVPLPPKPFRFPLIEVRAWGVSGKRLDANQLLGRLRQAKNIVALPKDEFTLDPKILALLTPETIFVYVEQLPEVVASSFHTPGLQPQKPQPKRATLVDHLMKQTGDVQTVPLGDFPPIPAGLFKGLALEDLEGTYRFHGTDKFRETNEWHRGTLTISKAGNRSQMIWRNEGDHHWALTPDLAKGLLLSDKGSPYSEDGATAFILIPEQDEDGKYLPIVAGYYFNHMFHRRDR